ncbi:hypothetical protein P3T76_008884 [Phytophthora citrophthora]|uniref:Uncharacterized protein n=1 Tax=Phytophthora citrophthora TaxID=4793 RepID=A0AAD9GI30_9STRA|nr:hypothetical protein P3T76_008884 [Phytophthora citrophthora]
MRASFGGDSRTEKRVNGGGYTLMSQELYLAHILSSALGAGDKKSATALKQSTDSVQCELCNAM